MSSTWWKDVIIGLLVGYVIVDLMMSMMSGRRTPSVIEKVFASIEDTGVMVSLGVGVVGGALVWYLCNKTDDN